LADWLGSKRRVGGWRSFKDARAFVRSLKLKNGAKWYAYCKSGKKPNDIPVGAAKIYANAGWAGMGDWLGTGRLNNADRRFRSFRDARAFARSLGLKGQIQWHAYCKSGKKPNDIPSNPNQVYDSWVSWPDWVGHGFRRGGWRSFEDARAFARSLKLKTFNDWRAYCRSGKKPDDIPTTPTRTYAGAWAGWPDWVGPNRTANGRSASV
jgi:hypothetical protein